MEQFFERLMEFPLGNSEGHYNDRRYAAAFSVSADGKRRKLYAEELGGNDLVSFNLYFLNSGDRLLKPCEMPAQKVIDFVLGYAPETAIEPFD